ncbi:MAG: UTRA domain-containing protein [Deinococcales bacterium]
MMQVLRISRLRTADTSLGPCRRLICQSLIVGWGWRVPSTTAASIKPPAQEFTHLHQARQIVSARLPSEQECERLEMHKYLPILQIIRIIFRPTGTHFECVRSAYRSDKYHAFFKSQRYLKLQRKSMSYFAQGKCMSNPLFSKAGQIVPSKKLLMPSVNVNPMSF